MKISHICFLLFSKQLAYVSRKIDLSPDGLKFTQPSLVSQARTCKLASFTKVSAYVQVVLNADRRTKNAFFIKLKVSYLIDFLFDNVRKHAANT